jgi:hypothetical protein
MGGKWGRLRAILYPFYAQGPDRTGRDAALF